MKIILRADVDQVGKRGDVVDVSDGHARNYLIPKGLAMRASAGNQAQAEEMRRAREIKDARERDAAQELATQLVPKTIHIVAKASESGHLFGSVSATDVVKAIKDQTQIELDPHIIAIDEPIKEIGTHYVMAKAHHDVQFPITVEVDTI